MVIVINSKKSMGFTVFLATLMFIIALSRPSSTVIYIREALDICGSAVIPALFPFTVLTGIITSNISTQSGGILFSLISKIFKISTVSVSALLLGMVCGFPIGGKIAVDLYKKNLISQEEAERLIAFTNNTGPAFSIGVVGCVIFGNISLGVLIYSTQIITSLVAGFILGYKKKMPHKLFTENSASKTAISKNISDASSAVLSVCGFVIFFYFTVQCIGDIIPFPIFKIITAALLEVSCGASEAAGIADPCVASALAAFSVGWSGLSVHMQLSSFLIGTDLSMKKYYLTKFICGLVNFIIVFLFVKLNRFSIKQETDYQVFVFTAVRNGPILVTAVVIIYIFSFILAQLEKKKNICYNTDIGIRKGIQK